MLILRHFASLLQFFFRNSNSTSQTLFWLGRNKFDLQKGERRWSERWLIWSAQPVRIEFYTAHTLVSWENFGSEFSFERFDARPLISWSFCGHFFTRNKNFPFLDSLFSFYNRSRKQACRKMHDSRKVERVHLTCEKVNTTIREKKKNWTYVQRKMIAGWQKFFFRNSNSTSGFIFYCTVARGNKFVGNGSSERIWIWLV